METHHRTGKLANTFLCFKEVMSTKHIRGPCQLHEPSRLQPKEVRNNLVTPGNNPKGLEPRQRCSRCPAALQTFKRCLSQTGVVLAAWMPKETRWAKITQFISQEALQSDFPDVFVSQEFLETKEELKSLCPVCNQFLLEKKKNGKKETQIIPLSDTD